jgi:hypothetical protein
LLNWSPQPYSGFPLGVNDLAIAPDGKSIYAVTDGDPMVVKVPIKADGTAGKATVVARGFSPFDGIPFDDKANVYVSEMLRSELWVLSPDGSKRALVASKKHGAAGRQHQPCLVQGHHLHCQSRLHPSEAGPGG